MTTMTTPQGIHKNHALTTGLGVKRCPSVTITCGSMQLHGVATVYTRSKTDEKRQIECEISLREAFPVDAEGNLGKGIKYFANDQTVRIDGLRAATQYNNRRGTVLSWDGEMERYAVWLDRPCYAKGKAEIVNLKHGNIHPTFGRTLKEEQDAQVICHKMISVADITMEDHVTLTQNAVDAGWISSRVGFINKQLKMAVESMKDLKRNLIRSVNFQGIENVEVKSAWKSESKPICVSNEK